VTGTEPHYQPGNQQIAAGALPLSGLRILEDSHRKEQDQIAGNYRKFSPELREEQPRYYRHQHPSHDTYPALVALSMLSGGRMT